LCIYTIGQHSSLKIRKSCYVLRYDEARVYYVNWNGSTDTVWSHLCVESKKVEIIDAGCGIFTTLMWEQELVICMEHKSVGKGHNILLRKGKLFKWCICQHGDYS
jgi:hypothetical protein